MEYSKEMETRQSWYDMNAQRLLLNAQGPYKNKPDKIPNMEKGNWTQIPALIGTFICSW